MPRSHVGRLLVDGYITSIPRASESLLAGAHCPLTLVLKAMRSCGVMVSALAMTGMRLTREPRRFMISMSRGFRLSWGRQCFVGTTRSTRHRQPSGPQENPCVDPVYSPSTHA